MVCAGEPQQTLAERGYELLVNKPYVPAAFHEDDLNEVWQVWPEPLRTKAEAATPLRRREMAFERYGLTARPEDDDSAREAGQAPKSLQFVVDGAGNWVTNCFSCHGGKVGGKTYPGAPNTDYALQTLTEEMRSLKLKKKRQLAPIDIGVMLMPLGSTNGTTNAVIFGVALAHFRDDDLNVVPKFTPPRMLHHDMDAPPWWHFRKKQMIYADGFAEKGHRGLLQMALDKSNGPEKFYGWEEDGRAIYAFLESVRPPKYPHVVDRAVADAGRAVFVANCAKCHGTYGAQESYPQVIVPIDDIGTDPVRFKSLTKEHRASYGRNWFSQYGKEKVIADTPGYQAPPLDGIWASAPYFHNGSVPTLWHVLNPETRPQLWRRTPNRDFDTEQVGHAHVKVAQIPSGITTAEKRKYFDTRRYGKSAAGHDYPAALTKTEKRQVLEYLKTL